MSNTRLEYIDVAKGLLICLMVFGHILNIATYQPEANIFVKNHYCPVKILDLEINRVDHHPLGR